MKFISTYANTHTWKLNDKNFRVYALFTKTKISSSHKNKLFAKWNGGGAAETYETRPSYLHSKCTTESLLSSRNLILSFFVLCK